ncbi:myo-inosose-2 dehydratase [Gluconacetobacter tumulicola]|uniref:Myo-inosose-2 dehydratase n=2 Tax=Gluconacetobacter tumulicola TaxID=1017177 RepID=A0A7W4JFN0_9PROT|nr:myo-inosose-2 dehydratase [Gluconacetobacter tumulicola]MBB2180397.1 myo-inosose-2 dehydratase [Gluconacetobacter tumulicola]
MAIRIGANPIIWSNDDLPSIGGGTSLQDCLSQARRAGIEGMELGNKFPRTVDGMKSALEPHGLDFISGWWSCNLLTHSVEKEIEDFQPRLALLKGMGCTVCIVCETSNAIHGDINAPLSTRPVLDDWEWRHFAERLTAFGTYLQDNGIALVYHHHMGTIVQDRADIARLMDSTGESVNLLLDAGHALWGGSDPAELARCYAGRIGHLHGKDVRPLKRAQADLADYSFLRAVLSGVFTMPGDGCIDFARIMRELPEYSGWIVLEAEQDPDLAQPLLYARMGRNYLHDVLIQTGHRQ